MGIHESQSLLWERMVGLSRPFCTYLLPKLLKAFPELPKDKSADDLYAAINKVFGVLCYSSNTVWINYHTIHP